MQPWPFLVATRVSSITHCNHVCISRLDNGTYERTKRSRFNHLGFLGLNFMNLLNKTWAIGAMPLRNESVNR